MAQEPHHIDRQALETLARDVGQPMVDNIIESFLEETAARLGLMRLHLEQRDTIRLQADAQVVRSAAAAMGFASLSEKARKFEGEVASMSVNDAAQWVEQLAEIFDESCNQLNPPD